jgi:hypothetical protein
MYVLIFLYRLTTTPEICNRFLPKIYFLKWYQDWPQISAWHADNSGEWIETFALRMIFMGLWGKLKMQWLSSLIVHRRAVRPILIQLSTVFIQRLLFCSHSGISSLSIKSNFTTVLCVHLNKSDSGLNFKPTWKLK